MGGERPLVTFALFAYNQERFIREAVEGAFAQTYSPLEIVLSDDCSSDGTFEIMREMAAKYRGPARIVLNRNPHNLGLIHHVNSVMARVSGELIVTAAGDDVSYPQRVEQVAAAWNENDKNPDGLFSGYDLQDGEDSCTVMPGTPAELETMVERCTVGVLGAAAAWTKRLWQQWGPLPPGALAEDQILSFRALLSGGLQPVPAVLVKYRHSERSRKEQAVPWRARKVWAWERNLRFYECYASELERIARTDSGGDYNARALINRIQIRRRCLERDVRLLKGGDPGLLSFCLFHVFGRTWYGGPFRQRIRTVASLLVNRFVRRKDAGVLDPRDHRAARRETV